MSIVSAMTTPPSQCILFFSVVWSYCNAMATDPRRLVFSREKIRAVDRRAVEEYGIPGIILMENAARGLVDHAMRILPNHGRVLIVCGGGNNGGDGFAAARHLHNRGHSVRIVMTKRSDRYSGDAAANLTIAQKMNLTMIDGSDDPVAALKQHADADLFLDGLLGTGLSKDVRSPLLETIQWMNEVDVPILAIDIPSGLDCDKGEPLGEAVRATQTVTFVGWKEGFLLPASRNYTGEIHVVDIGVPRNLAEELGDLK